MPANAKLPHLGSSSEFLPPRSATRLRQPCRCVFGFPAILARCPRLRFDSRIFRLSQKRTQRTEKCRPVLTSCCSGLMPEHSAGSILRIRHLHPGLRGPSCIRDPSTLLPRKLRMDSAVERGPRTFIPQLLACFLARKTNVDTFVRTLPESDSTPRNIRNETTI